MIDWSHFTPWSSLAGGALIGLAASLFVVVNGRIAGISGLLGSLLQLRGDGRGEKELFLLGLLVSPLVWSLFQVLPVVKFAVGWEGLVVAGLLVGLGTRYASGCTSGHGVCGVARHSPRSVVACVTFMLAGFATVYISRHVWGN